MAAAMRKQWGCDAATKETQFTLQCLTCEGLDAKCPECKGTGTVEYHRCPHTYVDPQHWSIVRAVGMADRGLMPAAGGWADQSATFVDALNLVRAEQRKYERAASKRAADAARRRTN